MMGRILTPIRLGTALMLAATAGGTGEAARDIRTVTAMTAAEREQGAKAHPDLLAEFGGLYDGPQAAYVAQVGRRIAVQSSLSSQQNDFTISLLNSPVNNAFAIPGGYVYVTRQLMALMNDEAELAGVLGHEIGHVAAQHSKQRQNAAQRNSILGMLGQVLVGVVAGNSGVGQLLQQGIGTGSQLLTLKFSRSQEYEADDLGIRYLASAGYDPRALSDMLASLAAQTALDGRVQGRDSATPEWASTHPDPAARVRRALVNAQATRSTSTVRNAETFLTNLDGMLYGEDPAAGIVEGRQFLHPAFRLKFTVPAGFTIQNGARAVSITGQSGQAQFTAASFQGDLDAHVQGIFAQLAGEGRAPAVTLQHSQVNDLPIAYGTAQMSNRNGARFDVTVVAYRFGPATAYHFLMITPVGQGMGVFSPMAGSVMRMSAAEAGAIRPRRVRLVTVRPGDTVQRLAARMAYDDDKVARFRVLNALPGQAEPQVGRRVKLITY